MFGITLLLWLACIPPLQDPPKIGIPRGEVPLDVSPSPKADPFGTTFPSCKSRPT